MLGLYVGWLPASEEETGSSLSGFPTLCGGCPPLATFPELDTAAPAPAGYTGVFSLSNGFLWDCTLPAGDADGRGGFTGDGDCI
jgi:hypothetical protein